MFLDSWRKRLSDVYNITINIRRHKRKKIRKLVLKFGQPTWKTIEGKQTMATPVIPGTPAAAVMADGQQLSATITPEDANGNVVPIPDGDAVVWSSSDPTIVTLTASVYGLSAVCASAAKFGSVTINVVINSAAGVAVASASGTIQVTPAGLSQVAISFGAPSAIAPGTTAGVAKAK